MEDHVLVGTGTHSQRPDFSRSSLRVPPGRDFSRLSSDATITGHDLLRSSYSDSKEPSNNRKGPLPPSHPYYHNIPHMHSRRRHHSQGRGRSKSRVREIGQSSRYDIGSATAQRKTSERGLPSLFKTDAHARVDPPSTSNTYRGEQEQAGQTRMSEQLKNAQRYAGMASPDPPPSFMSEAFSYYSEEDMRGRSPDLERVYPRVIASPSPPPVVTQVHYETPLSSPEIQRMKANRRKTRPTQGDWVLIREMAPNQPEIAQQVSQHALNSDSDSDQEEEDDSNALGKQPYGVPKQDNNRNDMPRQAFTAPSSRQASKTKSPSKASWQGITQEPKGRAATKRTRNGIMYSRTRHTERLRYTISRDDTVISKARREVQYLALKGGPSHRLTGPLSLNETRHL